MEYDLEGNFLKGSRAYATGRGGMTVRIKLPDGTDIALCTCTYGGQPAHSKQLQAETIAALWNNTINKMPLPSPPKEED